jgi:hypothetical protein
MVDITEISAVVAAAGVLVGVVYYILDMRNQSRTRKTELITRLYSTMVNKDWLEAWQKVQSREALNYGDYLEKYGFVELNEIFVYFDQLGRLLKKGLIDIDLIPLTYGQVSLTWEKIKPVLEGSRKRYNAPKHGEYAEYLCSELKRREQKLQQSKA